jgi:hypothetical protein
MRKIFILLTLLYKFALCQSPEEKFRIESSDVSAFWNAYDNFKSDTTLNPFAEYLDNGSRALKLLQRHRIKDADELKKVIVREMRYYNKVRETTLNRDSIENEVLKYFDSFKKIYPKAVLPKVYFVIGQLGTHVTTVHDTIIVCLENFARSSLVTSTGQHSALISDLPVLLAKSFVYTNNKPAHTGHTLLRECIIRGSVDFISTLFIEGERSRILAGENFVYGESHEEQVVREFFQIKDGSEFQNWLYNGNSQNRPHDLANWIGYKIVEAYYNSDPDKQHAIDEILKINDFDRFLQLSGYMDVFGN